MGWSEQRVKELACVQLIPGNIYGSGKLPGVDPEHRTESKS